MRGDHRRRVKHAMDEALCFQLEPAAEQRSTRSARPSAPPESTGARTRITAATPRPLPVDPLAGDHFRALRELRNAFGAGGLPSASERIPTDEARIAAFCVLQELLHLLTQYRRAIESGERARLVVSEHGRQLRKMVIELRIETEQT